jgi:hypothetical protein
MSYMTEKIAKDKTLVEKIGRTKPAQAGLWLANSRW